MKVPAVKRVQRYASVILRWLLIGAAVFGLTLAVGSYITNDVMTKVYTASSVVELPASDLATPVGSGLAPIALQPEFVNTMMSPDLLLGVVKELGLEKEWAARLHNADEDELPDVDALTRIERLVQVRMKDGDLVVITAASDVPREAADIANAVASHYQAKRGSHDPASPSLDVAPNTVRIVEHAMTPTEPSKPNKSVDYDITLIAACVLSLLAASFVEMVLLFVRAGERDES